MNRYAEIHGKKARFAARRFSYNLRLELIRAILKHGNNSRMLDIGSAHGDFGGDLARDGWIVTCLDINQEYLMVGKLRYRDIDFTRGDGQKLPFRDGSFDAVMIQNTLRYVSAPLQVLNESNRVLRTPGKLIIIDHNRFSVDTLWARNPEVIRLLSLKDLRQMLVQSNFEIIKTEYLFIPPYNTPHRLLSLTPGVGNVLGKVGLSRMFPEMFIYAVKRGD